MKGKKLFLLIQPDGYDIANFGYAKDFDFVIVEEKELDETFESMEDNMNSPDVIEINEKTLTKLRKILSILGEKR